MTSMEDTEMPSREIGMSQEMDTDIVSSQHLSSGRKNFDFWDHYKLEDNGGSGSDVYCNYCGKAYPCPSGNDPTDNLRTHLTNECKGFPYPLEDEGRGSDEESDDSNFGDEIFSQRRAQQALVRWIIMDGLPFTIVKA